MPNLLDLLASLWSFVLNALSLTSTIGFFVLFIVGWLIWNYLSTKNNMDKRQRATKATAKIVNIGHSRNSEKYAHVTVYLTLEIIPPNGAPYQLDTKWWVKPGQTSQVEVGRTVNVKIDAKNPNVIYSGESWFRDTNY